MNYNETRDLIRSLTEKLASISRTLSDVCIMFQTDSEGNPTIEAKDQLFFEQRKFLAKQVLPRDLKSLSLELIDSIPAIQDYLENWCNKQTDPDIDSLSLALSNLIDNKSAMIEKLVPGYNDFISDCFRVYDKTLAKNVLEIVSHNRYSTTKEMLRNQESFKVAVTEEAITDDGNKITWNKTKQELIQWLFDNQLIERKAPRQWDWEPWDCIFHWFSNREGRFIPLTTNDFIQTVNNLKRQKGWEPGY